MRSRALAVLALAATGALASAAAAPEPGSLRAEFRQALLDAGARGSSVAPDSEALRSYILYPYVEAARLRSALAAVPAAQREAAIETRIAAFLQREAGRPVLRELRREWIAYLAAREDWKGVLADSSEGGDLATQCHGWAAKLAPGKSAPPREAVIAAWLDTRDPPTACTPAFQWAERQASPAELELRAIAAAKQRVKLPALERLPAPRRALVEGWDRLMADPERALRQLADAPPAGGEDADLGEAVLEAFDRLARRDAKRSAPLYEKLRGLALLTAAQRDRLLRSHALGLAYDFLPESVAAFKALPESAVDLLAQEWRLRAALLQGDRAQAEAWLELLSPAQKLEPRWRYWGARLREQRGDPNAKAAYAEVAKEREFYGFLAAERAGLVPDLRPVAVPEDKPVAARLRAIPGIQRAEELFRCDLADLAAVEFRAVLATEPPAGKAQAARLASGWGWNEIAVRVLSEMQQWDDLWLRYPLPWDAEVVQAAREANLPPEWVHTVLRTESLYNPRAVSRAGALGLLQLTLSTARLTAKRFGLPRPAGSEDLFEPGNNLRLGARHLGELREKFGGRFILTLVAYNAGPQRVPQWLPPRPVDADVWIENIPYNETRQYVQRNLSSLVILGWRRGGEPAKLLPLLGPVTSSTLAPAAFPGPPLP